MAVFLAFPTVSFCCEVCCFALPEIRRGRYEVEASAGHGMRSADAYGSVDVYDGDSTLCMKDLYAGR